MQVRRTGGCVLFECGRDAVCGNALENDHVLGVKLLQCGQCVGLCSRLAQWRGAGLCPDRQEGHRRSSTSARGCHVSDHFSRFDAKLSKVAGAAWRQELENLAVGGGSCTCASNGQEWGVRRVRRKHRGNS